MLLATALSAAAAVFFIVLSEVWKSREERFIEFVGLDKYTTLMTARPDRETREKLQPVIDAKMDQIFATIVELRRKIDRANGPERDILRRDIQDERALYERRRRLVGHFGFWVRAEGKRSKALARG